MTGVVTTALIYLDDGIGLCVEGNVEVDRSFMRVRCCAEVIFVATEDGGDFPRLLTKEEIDKAEDALVDAYLKGQRVAEKYSKETLELIK